MLADKTTTRRPSRLLQLAAFALLGLLARPAAAAPDAWILSLAWTPEYCDTNLGSKEPQCTEERFFTVNGLEPVFNGAKPGCGDGHLERAEVERWLVVIPNRARSMKVWRSQGACSGLSLPEYFVQLERASRRLVVPQEYERVTDLLQTSPTDFKQAFIRDNPGLTERSIALRCRGRWLREVEACFDSNFGPKSCEAPENCPDPLRLRPLRQSREGREPVYP